MANKIILRCPDCAYYNPQDTKFCGMCGCRLIDVEGGKFGKFSKTEYRKSVASGSIGKTSGYAYSVWLNSFWMMIMLSTITVVVIAFLVVATLTFPKKGGSLAVWIIIDWIVGSLLMAGWCRTWLDMVRGSGIMMSRAFGSALSNALPAMFLTLQFILVGLLMSGIIWIWFIPVDFISGPLSPIPSGFAGFLTFMWMAALLVLLLLPGYIWLTMGYTIAMCRVIDRKSGPWAVSIWAVVQIIEHHWDLFKIGMGQLWAQIIGVIICYIGTLATVPLSGVTFAALYEWARLRGKTADRY